MSGELDLGGRDTSTTVDTALTVSDFLGRPNFLGGTGGSAVLGNTTG